MENVGIGVFYSISAYAPIGTIVTPGVFCGNESLILVFHFLFKAIVLVYYSVYLPLLLSKMILSCSLCFHRLINILYPKIDNFFS